MHQLLEAVRRINAARRWKVEGEPREKTYKRGPVEKITAYCRGQISAEMRSHPFIDKILFDPRHGENSFEFSFKTEGGVRSTVVAPGFKPALERRGYSINSNYYPPIDRTVHHIWHGPNHAGNFSTKTVQGREFPIYVTAHEKHAGPILSELFGAQKALPKPRKKTRAK